MKTVAVVTATTGRESLTQAVQSVARQTYPCKHYVFHDGKEGESVDVPEMAHTFIPFRTGGNGLMNAGIVSASAFLVQEDMICWLDDDNWFEPNHIESLVEAKGDKRYAHSLRTFRNPDGTIFDRDDCESLGHWTQFVDLNCYLMDRDLARDIAPLWYKTTGDLMVGDRYVYPALTENKIDWACTGLYTLNYRLNPDRELRPRFFETNIRNRAQFKGELPWAR